MSGSGDMPKKIGRVGRDFILFYFIIYFFTDAE